MLFIVFPVFVMYWIDIVMAQNDDDLGAQQYYRLGQRSVVRKPAVLLYLLYTAFIFFLGLRTLESEYNYKLCLNVLLLMITSVKLPLYIWTTSLDVHIVKTDTVQFRYVLRQQPIGPNELCSPISHHLKYIPLSHGQRRVGFLIHETTHRSSSVTVCFDRNHSYFPNGRIRFEMDPLTEKLAYTSCMSGAYAYPDAKCVCIIDSNFENMKIQLR